MSGNALPAVQDEGGEVQVTVGTIGAAFASETMRNLYAMLALPRAADAEVVGRKMTAVNQMLASFGAETGLEHLLAKQGTAMHLAAMAALQQSTHPDVPAETASRLRRDASRLFKGVVEMAEAIQRLRNSGKSVPNQIVRVEHISLQPGAQAVIGNVTPGSASTGG